MSGLLQFELQEGGSNLSGGFAQSVALSRVFLRPNAQLLILDEAMGQMDGIKKRELIFPALMKYVKEHHQTLIIVTHDLPFVCPLVDWIYVMEKGKLIQSGTHTQLNNEKAKPYSRLIGQDIDQIP